MLRPDDKYTLSQLDTKAKELERTATLLREAVAKCHNSNNLEGLADMVAFAFNAAAHKPSYGGGSGGLPPGKYKGVIVDSRLENVEKAGVVTGGYMAFDLTPIEGPLAGSKQTDRLNLNNSNPKVVEIANGQLSAYCHVLNMHQWQDTAQLHNIPFYFEIGFQKGHEPTAEKPEGGYTEVKGIYDLNGNPPGKAGAGPQVGGPVGGQAAPQQQQQQQPPANVTPQGGWDQAGTGGQQQQPPAQQQQQPPAGGGAWGANGGGQQQPPAQQQQAPAGGGWAQTGGGAAGGTPPGWG